MNARKIITTFIYPPIPIRSCDWQAHFDGDEPDDNGQMWTESAIFRDDSRLIDIVEWYKKTKTQDPSDITLTIPSLIGEP